LAPFSAPDSTGFTHILGGCRGVIERFFRSVDALNNDSLGAVIDLDDRPLGDFDAVYADQRDATAFLKRPDRQDSGGEPVPVWSV